MLEQQLINGLMLGGIYVLVAVAFTLTIGILNFLNFSIPGIFMLSGVFTWFLLKSGVHWALALAGAIAIGAAASFVVERFTYRWMRSSDHYVPLVSSMGFLILFENLVLVQWGSDLQRVVTPFADLNIRPGSLVISIPQLVSLVLAVCLVAGLQQLLQRTQMGRALRAIAENATTAEILGIGVVSLVPAVFVIGGLFAALGGMLFALNYQQVHPFMGEEVALKGISAMVIGGMGNVWGSVLGGLLIGIVEVLSIHFLNADFVDFTVYGLLLLILFFKPTGLLGASKIVREKF
ncbi:MAG: branched-chain amino acid ABC transporter permease [Paracoccaceae bacterium]|nr:branched-chain amino acid ABC transporter permease [Paracoccaceae bacterium]